jgi:hypothetical protein
MAKKSINNDLELKFTSVKNKEKGKNDIEVEVVDGGFVKGNEYRKMTRDEIAKSNEKTTPTKEVEEKEIDEI